MPEAPLRKNRRAKNIFSFKLTEDEYVLAQKLSQTILSLMDDKTLLLFPSAVGGHIDHVIVKKACLFLVNKHQNYMQYLDLPYAAMINNIDTIIYNKFSTVMMFKINHEVKQNILACYPSQLYQKQIKAILEFDFNDTDDSSKEILFR